MREPSNTRDRILTTGANLLSQAGLSGVTIGSLAELSSMSKSGLFAHFKSKDELQIALLGRTAEIANSHIIAPSFAVEQGLPRLKALVQRWLGWTRRAGLDGGCPVAAGLFELDDAPGPVRERLLEMETSWRQLLVQLTQEAVQLGHLRRGLDAEQFVWELCSIYLGHHVSLRFVNDPKADKRAAVAFTALIRRALPASANSNREPTGKRK